MGNIQMLGESDDWQVKGEAPKLLRWSLDLGYERAAEHSLDFWLAREDLPALTAGSLCARMGR